ncbi:MAG: ABC transporter ATP-binding protein [Candidatus Omnitrophica bacterium]|nr:ABC transporter ATP-binding protein [Candidatus Omnitrophota bacterium]
MTHAIEIQNLTKIFRPGTSLLNFFSHTRQFSKRVWALNRVNLNVRQGEVFALLGPNGAGKTTLIKILSSLILPDRGNARIYGYDIQRETQRAKKFLSVVVGDERSFYWRLTGRQNLEFFATLYGYPNKTIRERIKKVANFFEIPDLDIRFQEYSTGTKYRLALARSFLSDAKLLFMDEPTRSLDYNAATRLRRLITDRFKKDPELTVFFSTHILQEAEQIADRIAIINHGRIKCCGTLEELRHLAGNPNASLEEIFELATRPYMKREEAHVPA